ncbi:KGGVGR-motif variant AAA ATPase [Shinella fusca]|uniref:MinD-like ATPase involved in chromosome partitioning or flagellar assembly n=1 Tax=Shinella fusca TaxID=544480 RepID=A0A7W7YZF3_9HYPH|nr:P-loop NTPase [Shinella fusca]MBB5045000.1 MinD-like ATPase involved in chromosome partitioning or flagellar assembly [Shinella fusca]
MSETPFFDEALLMIAEQISAHWGPDALLNGVIVRDSVGHLKFVAANDAESAEDPQTLLKALQEVLGPYARADGVLAFADEPGAARLLAAKDRLFVDEGGYKFWLIDRRIVGAAWLSEPVSTVAVPSRVVFASLKGGVGRSTALTVTAADLAARGRNVLVVDLDLEAPGLGELLLSDDRAPEFGVADYLVENGIGGVTDQELHRFIGTSTLTSSGGGRVDVLPALGSSSVKYPANVLAKLSRAMTDDVDEMGNVATVGSQISQMIERMTGLESYDVVLIDSRAGLAELAAPAVLSLGALVLFFGTAQQQTIRGYRSLFAALRLLAQRSVQLGQSSDWRLMIRPVYAKASMNGETAASNADNLYELFAENLYDDIDEEGQVAEAINFAPDDPDAPHHPLVIPFDSRFLDFDPAQRGGQLLGAFFEQTYRPFLDKLYSALEILPGQDRTAST